MGVPQTSNKCLRLFFMPYTLQGNCVHKENADGTAGETVKCHETREQALAHLRALEANTEYTMRIFDQFVNTKIGEPFRLFPFGQIVKNGNVREITAEFAQMFKLPHFKPPIKLGSHDDPTPAGGHIVGLEVREDGLYAVPEWNEQGLKALENGAYRYHSPEIIWGEGGLEDPTSGQWITGPLVLGDALLHTPHLGEATALYTINKEQPMPQIDVPQTIWDKFTAMLNREPEKVEVVPEDYTATKAERDEYKTQLESMKAEAIRAERVQKFSAELSETHASTELAELLAELPEEKSEAVMKQFRALSEQIDASKLTEEVGSEGGAVEDPKAEFNALVLKFSAENKIGYNQAFDLVKAQNSDLYAQAFKK